MSATFVIQEACACGAWTEAVVRGDLGTDRNAAHEALAAFRLDHQHERTAAPRVRIPLARRRA